MLSKHKRHKPGRWLAASAAFVMALSVAGPFATPVYAAGDTDASTTQTSYVGFSAVSDVKVNNVSVKRYGHYNLRFNGNGNTGGSMDNQTDILLDKKLTLTNGYTKTGYHFSGWNTKADGSGLDFKDKQSVTADDLGAADGSSVTLYAQWAPNTYTIHYDANMKGVTGSMADQTLTYDVTGVLTNNAFVKEGYQLTGWKGSDGKTYSNMDIVRNLSTKNKDTITLTGQWTEAVDVAKTETQTVPHEHHLVQKYDDTYHWKECTICGEIFDKEKHSDSAGYQDHWTMGSADASCSNNNIHIRSCSCGWEKEDTEGRKAHSDLVWLDGGPSYSELCKVCGEFTGNHKKKDQETLTANPEFYFCDWTFKDDFGKQVHMDANNWYLNNGYADGHPVVDDNYVYTLEKGNAGPAAVDIKKSTMKMTVNDDKSVTVDASIYVVQDTKFNTDNFPIMDVGYQNTGTVTGTTTQDGHYVKSHFTVKFKESLSRPSCIMLAYGGRDLGDPWTRLDLYCAVAPDNTAPVITSADVTGTNVQASGWNHGATIEIHGTEEYSNTVKLSVKDKSGREILDGNPEVEVKDGKWSYQTTLNAEAAANGSDFTVTVTDDFNNKSTRKTTASKIDSIAPVLTNPLDVSKVSTDKVKWSSDPDGAGEWHRSVDWTAIATDYGSGDVKIGLNTFDDYKDGEKQSDGNTYTRKFHFTGNKSDGSDYRIFLEDAAGNTVGYDIPVGKFDNTAPHVEKTGVDGQVIDVKYDDQFEDGGEGSGVAKIGYLDTSKALSKDDSDPVHWQKVDAGSKSGTITLPKNGTYLIFAEDAVGNRSQGYQVTVTGAASGAKKSVQTIFNENE